MTDILGERDSATPQDKTHVAEPSRESQLPKRFYDKVDVELQDDIYVVLLDGRPVRTPGKALLASSANDVSEMLAVEWRVQEERIDPMTMPVTRLANTAVDGVANDMQAVKEDIVRYSCSDLLCYRAAQPQPLVDRQTETWDPFIDWAQSDLGARFALAQGVTYIDQPPESIAAFNTHVGLISDPMVLAGAHVVTSLTGSAIIAMAVVKGAWEVDDAWAAAHIDEDWNIEQWGQDFEAEERRAFRYKDMKAACDCIKALR